MIYYRVPTKGKSDNKIFLPYEATMSVLRMELHMEQVLGYPMLQPMANFVSAAE